MANKIERAHQMYRDGLYEEALRFYTEALAMARTNPQKIALHSNRAACYLKLHLFQKAAEECTSVLELDHMHTGALMLRAQTLVTLKEYHSALFDVNRLIELNPSSEVYQNLHARLKTQVSLAPIPELPESEELLDEEEEAEDISKHNRDYEDKCDEGKDNGFVGEEKSELLSLASNADLIPSSTKTTKRIATVVVTATQTQTSKESPEPHVNGWKTIPKPKGHSTLDYARWDRVENDSSDDDDDDDDEEESQPQYRFRVKTVGVRPVQ